MTARPAPDPTVFGPHRGGVFLHPGDRGVPTNPGWCPCGRHRVEQAGQVLPAVRGGGVVSAEARANGWRGFDGLAEKVPNEATSRGGWQYRCDGMPSMMGCPATVVVSRRWTKVGKKKSGWLVCYGLEPETNSTPFDDKARWHPDEDVVLTYCPSCAAEVARQEAGR